MPKEEWGTKRLCSHCATRFYDLKNDPMTCPACNASFTAESLTPSGRARTLAAEKASARARTAPEEEGIVEDNEVIDEEGAELDDDLLDEEDDDEVSLDDIADVAGDEEE